MLFRSLTEQVETASQIARSISLPVVADAGAGVAAFRNILTHAYRAGASGYLAGRAIWLKAFQAFPDWDAIRSGLRGEAIAYMEDINALTDAEAAPWPAHPRFGAEGAGISPADATFRHHYSEFGG